MNRPFSPLQWAQVIASAMHTWITIIYKREPDGDGGPARYGPWTEVDLDWETWAEDIALEVAVDTWSAGGECLTNKVEGAQMAAEHAARFVKIEWMRRTETIPDDAAFELLSRMLRTLISSRWQWQS